MKKLTEYLQENKINFTEIEKINSQRQKILILYSKKRGGKRVAEGTGEEILEKIIKGK